MSKVPKQIQLRSDALGFQTNIWGRCPLALRHHQIKLSVAVPTARNEVIYLLSTGSSCETGHINYFGHNPIGPLTSAASRGQVSRVTRFLVARWVE